MSKRLNGEGSIYPDKARGGWRGSVRYNDPVTGEAKRKSVTGATREIVAEKLGTVTDTVALGKTPAPARGATFKDYAAEWLTTELVRRQMDENMKANTMAVYANAINNHLVPLIGSVRLSAINPKVIRTLALQLATKPVRTDAAGNDVVRSAAIRRQCVIAMRAVMGTAAKDGLVNVNHALDMTTPKPVRVKPEQRAFEPDEITAVNRGLADPANAEHAVFLAFLFLTGCRLADALTLTWSRVDLDACTVHVHSKTAAGDRAIAIPARLADLLRAHRITQTADRLAAHTWTDNGLVFPNRIGGQWDRHKAGRRARTFLVSVGITDGTAHTFRHNAVSTMLRHGASPVEVAAVVGHADPAFTLRTYGHKTTAGTTAAMAALGEALAE